MIHYFLLAALLLTASALWQEQAKRIGEIEFFGYGAMDLQLLRAGLPFHEGGSFNIEKGEETVRQAREAVTQIAGHPPTDISVTCCDAQGQWIIFIGLSGKPARYHSRPHGAASLPTTAIDLYERFMNAMMEAVQKGAAAEDRSRGYALSEDPSLRSTQLEMRAYAVGREALLRKVLGTAAEDQQRAAAAQLLGYARRSRSQLAALAQASHDNNSIVRNNAVRALAVLAESEPKFAGEIPLEGFVDQLLSGNWTDLNKASLLLATITHSRSAKALAQLRRPETRERLIEMARWRTGHAEAAMYLLGRAAGIAEARLEQMVSAGKVEEIIIRLQVK